MSIRYFDHFKVLLNYHRYREDPKPLLNLKIFLSQSLRHTPP